MKKYSLFILSVFITLYIPLCSQAQRIQTIVGNGISAYNGDGEPATAAQLSKPYRICSDRTGTTIYIADLDRIRMVSILGIVPGNITTIAGNGLGTHSGDGGPAIAAGIIITSSVAIDNNSGNIYIAEDSNINSNSGSWIRKIDTAGIITTIAGNGIHGTVGMADQLLLHNFKTLQI